MYKTLLDFNPHLGIVNYWISYELRVHFAFLYRDVPKWDRPYVFMKIDTE